ncbi:bifunctional UDP-N-acetylmuramoyl-tripeptide:D-alanyl-D-alanine ligase/alanine racemase [Sphingobacterium bambusae]|uniref:Alanine racemase n=1 Tax=Sphingobacterium bambusae TaxID=662858 RepID=A0ABW6BBE1_9SPHI|nr:bifunctional UDP-N-acetylmuramoyl-tripeptide:D-alanyl-D-alanine ligase/alanine racemase [Sphingobacterium bambusae]WPL49207.1 bifunctional UDP-N-acetylmuramoyl-tripeptide:D-alanyl-D-alanine ligase/alanine racemase [Sphingobacterium bambusae]
MYTVADIYSILHASTKILVHPALEIFDLAYDTRKIRRGGQSLFFALKSIRDGHAFIGEAYRKGVRAFVLSQKDIDVSLYPEGNFIWVNNVLLALQQLAAYHRTQFKKPVIGITGSNGKTVVKEWLTQLLQDDRRVYQSPKSYNSQLGVALALWNLSDEYDCAIIEAGISQPGEMVALEAMTRPEIGVFTNIGAAHASGFASKQDKIVEKLKLFTHSKDLLFPSRYGIASMLPEGLRVFSFGTEPMDEVQVLRIEDYGRTATQIQVAHAQEIATFSIPFRDKASVENALICITVLLFFGYSLDAIASKLTKLKPLDMRLQLKKGKNGCSVIDDTYSNDLASLQIALDFLFQQQQHQKRTLILSDMDGLDDKLRQKLLALLQRQELDRIVLVGKGTHFMRDQLHTTVLLFDSTEALLLGLKDIPFQQESILIKGSRAYHLEEVSRVLVSKSHETVLEINLNALEHNLQVYRGMLPSGVKMMAMVKAFSYGSGSYEVANLLQFNKLDYLTVAFADEGVELRQGGITLPIMVLSPDEQVFETLLTNELEPEIYSFRILHAFITFLDRRQIKDFPIHIKIDTGMHRLGFMPEEMDALIQVLRVTEAVRPKSVFSHLVASGSRDHDDFTRQQLDTFARCAALLESELDCNLIKHIANTSAIVHWPEAYLDMVRLGIGLYGVDMDRTLDVEQVSTLKTTITQIKELPAGETVGYDRKGVLHRASRIATVKIGYADGYSRRFGQGVGQMSINGQLVQTVGSICMDMCMLDVTDIVAYEEDEVVVFPDLMKAAADIGTIPYELLVNISSRVKRVYFYG